MAGIDTYTKLLLHCDGADGSTTFSDSSNNNHTVTANGSVEIDTAQSKFGGASGLFTSTSSDYLSVPDSADWNFGSNPFTVDFWIRPIEDLDSQNRGFFRQRVDWGNQIFCFVDGGRLSLRVKSGSVITVSLGMASPYGWTANTWYHIAVIRGWGGNTDDWALCIDGTAEATVTDSDSVPDYAAPFEVGRAEDAGGTLYYFNGHIDEFRVSKGIARWTSNFTPPTKAYSKGTGGGLIIM